MGVNDAQDAADLVSVAVDCRLDVLLGVELPDRVNGRIVSWKGIRGIRTKENQFFCPKYGPCPLIWKCFQACWVYFSGKEV